MLHKVLLRLSLFIALFALIAAEGFHLYKKDIFLFFIQRALHTEMPDAHIDIDYVTGFFPFDTTFSRVKISIPHIATIKADEIKITLDPLHCIGNVHGTNGYALKIDSVKLKNLVVQRLDDTSKAPYSPSPDQKSSTDRQAKPFWENRPKITISTFIIDGQYHDLRTTELASTAHTPDAHDGHITTKTPLRSDTNNKHHINTFHPLDPLKITSFHFEGYYSYDVLSLKYKIDHKTFSNTGEFSLFKMYDARLTTRVLDLPLEIAAPLTNLYHIPLHLKLGDHVLEGILSDQGANYHLSATYRKTLSSKETTQKLPQDILQTDLDKTSHIHAPSTINSTSLTHSVLSKMNLDKKTFFDISWDKNDLITLQHAETQLGQHTLKLHSSCVFDIKTQHFLNDIIFHFDQESLTLHNFGFSPTLSGELSGRFKSLDFLKKDFDGLDVSGELSLNAKIKGTIDNPHIDIELISNKLKHRKISPLKIEKSHIKIAIADQKLTLDGLINGKNELSLKIKGTSTLSSMDIRGDLYCNLRHIKKLIPTEDQIDAIIRGNFTLQGDPFSPRINGECTVSKGYYGNYIVGTHITDIQGKATLSNDKIHLSFSGNDDFKGTLKVEGTLDFASFSKGIGGEIHLNLHQFFLGQSDLFTGRANGKLSLLLGKKIITGTLLLDPVIVDIDQLTPSATPKIKLIDTAAAKSFENEKLAPTAASDNALRFDITLTPQKDVIVRGFGIESTWKGGLKIQGTKPDFVGKFFLTKGTIDITGRILNFTKGEITFDHKIDEPYLDLEITKKIDSYDVYVQLKGRPSDTKFTFISSPALTQEEVLALILFGRKSAASSLGQLFDISASLSSMSIAGQDKSFFTTFRKIFGIETLEIKTQDNTSGTSESPQALSVRKQISPDFNIVIEQTLNATEEESKSSKAIIEKQINDNWNVEFDVSTDKSGSVGLNWIKRY